MLGGRIDALELGTIVRYPVGSEVEVVLPPDLCWAYPERQSVRRLTAIPVPANTGMEPSVAAGQVGEAGPGRGGHPPPQLPASVRARAWPCRARSCPPDACAGRGAGRTSSATCSCGLGACTIRGFCGALLLRRSFGGPRLGRTSACSAGRAWHRPPRRSCAATAVSGAAAGGSGRAGASSRRTRAMLRAAGSPVAAATSMVTLKASGVSSRMDRRRLSRSAGRSSQVCSS